MFFRVNFVNAGSASGVVCRMGFCLDDGKGGGVPMRKARAKKRAILAAMVVAARTRPKFIGGARAMYDETML